jgi:hypothetical protein
MINRWYQISANKDGTSTIVLSLRPELISFGFFKDLSRLSISSIEEHYHVRESNLPERAWLLGEIVPRHTLTSWGGEKMARQALSKFGWQVI